MCLVLSGCFGPKKPVTPVCADLAVYKSYDINMPDRPELTVDKLATDASTGMVARAYERDLINVIEYAVKLENILVPIVEDQDTINITSD